MSAMATAANPAMVTRIFELRRDDNDRAVWEPIATVALDEPVNIALTCWLLEEEPPPGTYKAERNGARSEQSWTGSA